MVKFFTTHITQSNTRPLLYWWGMFSIRALSLTFFVFFSKAQVGAQSCNCTEYIYLNERFGDIHKFAVDPNYVTSNPAGNSLTEIGSPWLSSGWSFPHGLGMDINGNVYIGQDDTNPPIRKITCDGVVTPAGTFSINDGGYNITSYKNILYVNSFNDNNTPGGNRNGIYAYDLCTGNALGYICLNGLTQNEDDWGLFIDDDGTAYITASINANNTSSTENAIWRFDIESAVLNPVGNPPSNCIDPFLTESASSDVSVGDMAVPGDRLYGITTDASGNIYVIHQITSSDETGSGHPSQSSRIIKYNSGGQVVAISGYDISDDGGGTNIFRAAGIVYSDALNLLYVSSQALQDACATLWDTNLNYIGVAVPQPPGGGSRAKGIAIIKECCPNPSVQTIDLNVCSASVGDKFYLNDILGCGSENGVICEGTWSEVSSTGLAFESCDLSITVTSATGCGQYRLQKASGTTGNLQCGAFDIIVNICLSDVGGSLSQSACQGNGTNMNSTDDYFTVTVTGTTSNPNTTGNYEVVINANANGTGGTVLGVNTYGSPITVGDGVNGATGTFAADGSTLYTITIRDENDPTCHTDLTTTAVNSCAGNCPIIPCGTTIATKNN